MCVIAMSIGFVCYSILLMQNLFVRFPSKLMNYISLPFTLLPAPRDVRIYQVVVYIFTLCSSDLLHIHKSFVLQGIVYHIRTVP